MFERANDNNNNNTIMVVGLPGTVKCCYPKKTQVVYSVSITQCNLRWGEREANCHFILFVGIEAADMNSAARRAARAVTLYISAYFERAAATLCSCPQPHSSLC